MSELVDANVFIRLLTADDARKFELSLALMERAERGEVRLVTIEAMVAEIVYVLSSAIYRVPRATLVERLRPVLENPGLTIEHKRAVLEALDLYGQTSLDFEDCLAVAHMRRLGLTGIYSYDRDFERVPSVNRLEP